MATSTHLLKPILKPQLLNNVPKCGRVVPRTFTIYINKYGIPTRYFDSELKLQVVDSSVVLLAIIKLGDSNSSAKWLHSTGLTDEAIIRFIKEDFTACEEPKWIRDSRGRKRLVTTVLTFTQPTISTINYLGRLCQDLHPMNGLYIAHVLTAITCSDSRTVRRIFASVGLGMADVRKQLNIPSITDLETVYSQSH